MRKNSKHKLIVVIISICLLLTSVILTPTYAAHQKNVLIINSYHYGLSWTDDIDSAITETIKTQFGNDVRIYMEYMDWKEYPTQETLDQFQERIEYKYKDKQIDLVITSDDAALRFVETNRNSIFKDLPIVFCGVSEENFRTLAVNDNLITGVIEKVDIEATLEVAMQVNPTMETLYIVHDQTGSGKAMTDTTIAELYKMAPGIKTEVITDLTIDQIIEKVSKLSRNDSLLMTAYYTDIEGQNINFEDMIEKVSEATPAVVFSLYDFAIGHGAIGGGLLSGRMIGERTGELAVSILKGTNPNNLPLVDRGFIIDAIDYDVASRFGIDTTRLSKDIEIINQPVSIFELYRGLFITIAIIMSLMMIFLVVLSFYLRKMVKLKNELAEKNTEQVQLNEELMASEEELKAQFDALNSLFEELQSSKVKNELILDAIKDTIVDWDIKEQSVSLSENWHELIDLPLAKIGSPEFIFDYIHHEDIEQIKPYFSDELPFLSNDFITQVRLKTNEAHFKWFLVKGAVKRDRQGFPTRMISSFTDIDGIKQMEDQIRYAAFHDGLTGLGNKNALEATVQKDIKKGILQYGILLVDIDHFKRINDTMGHRFGDKYIKAVGKILELQLGPNSSIYRISGDEFIIYHRMSDPRELEALGRHLTSVMNRIIQVEYSNFSNSVSVGISNYPQDGDNLDDLITRADLAMYKSKESGRGKVLHYNSTMFEKIIWRVEREEALKHAIANHELYLAFQPQIDCKTKEIIGFEALIRWSNPKLGQITPLEFIPIAEETQLIMPIGKWVIDETLTFINEINKISNKRIHVAVNVSVLQLIQEDFEELLLESLSLKAISPDQFVIEITESVLMQAIDATAAKLERLQAIGLKVALDDFGTGYSSLSYLKNLPIDILKIDKSFVDTLGETSSHDDLIRMIVQMGQELGLHMVAEGVEHQSQLEMLQTFGCNAMQGYYYSKPLSKEDSIKLLQIENKN